MSEKPTPGEGRPRAKSRGKPKPKSQPKSKKRKFRTRLHRWLGLWSFAIVLVIAITGIALNHTEALKLDATPVTSRPVLKRYGMEPQGEPVAFQSPPHLLAVWGGECLFDGVAVEAAPDSGRLVAAGRVGADEFVFVFPKEVIVCDPEGGLVDRLDEASLPPGRIETAGAVADVLVLRMASGERLALHDWLEAVPATGPEPDWFSPLADVSAEQKELLASALRGQGLPMSRVVLDLHSGRFFGTIGVIVYDLAATCLVFLGVTGVMLWWRRR